MKSTRSTRIRLSAILTAASLPAFAAPGQLDRSFGILGKVTTATGAAADIGNSVAIQADGGIIVAGKSHNGANWDFAVCARPIGTTANQSAFRSIGHPCQPDSNYHEDD